MFKILRYLKKRDVLFIVISAAFIVGQVYFELKMPDYTKELTTIVQMESNDLKEVFKNGAMMLLCAVLSMLSAIGCSYFSSRVSSSLSRNLRKEIFERVNSFSDKETNKFSTSSLITRTTNDVVQVQNFMSMGLHLLIKSPIMAVWAIIKISNANIKWTLATAICVLVIIIFVVIIASLCLPRFKIIQKLTDDLNNAARENISGVRVIRAFNAEEYQSEKYEEVNNKITKTHIFTSKTTGLLMPVLNVCLNGLVLVIYWIGVVLINNINFDTDPTEAIALRVETIANMSVFSQYALQIIASFMMLVIVFIMLPRTMVSVNRIVEVLNTETKIKDGNVTDINKDTSVVFNNVSFAYHKNENKALEAINFNINKGETVAIIGSTGCGKTTLINLLSRFYDVTEGEILIKGINVKEYNLKTLRSLISLAPQKALLFKGTIKTNIIYGSKENEDKLIKCLNNSCCDFVNDLENKVNSEVAQKGNNFSGGQKQRLSIARALYKDSDIYIFDDTFSALDYKTDSLVRKNLRKDLKDKIVIIVAQRIGTVKNADKIIVMDKGKIVDIGKHDELLKRCDTYKEIALSQLDKEEL